MLISDANLNLRVAEITADLGIVVKRAAVRSHQAQYRNALEKKQPPAAVATQGARLIVVANQKDQRLA